MQNRSILRSFLKRNMAGRNIMSVPALFLLVFGTVFLSCGVTKNRQEDESASVETESIAAPVFSSDSAYEYVRRQVEFSPRVPNTEAHSKAGDWLVAMLKRNGAEVIEQKTVLTAFDGTPLHVRNIFAQFNPKAGDRTLLLAHWDCRPWADEDSDAGKRRKPVDGANDGASGVAVLLETARVLGANPLPSDKGVDILFVDAEDWGTDDNEESWAMGANYFVSNPILPGYKPQRGILLDMVGSKDATFYKEYFSEIAAPSLNAEIWNIAGSLGYDKLFLPEVASAVTDDHRPLIAAGIPCIDIIDYRKDKGFDPVWHTTSDNMDNISAETLGAVGNTIVTFLYK